jgi:hypothetical protein
MKFLKKVFNVAIVLVGWLFFLVGLGLVLRFAYNLFIFGWRLLG